ncbi:bacteriocin [Pararobbsia silviterrae]|uniref:Bacteriocin n=1 Tax=Pararobbsia silviterrae TaxID=1792498 RepID=A0A494XWI2_9BURK|nr:bacteriocin [Pararobbsia silviterrae]RKP53346.1 bacteriocin [Pararobbsia silviterrae]
MNATLSIKDLAINKELSNKELASVRGGSNYSSIGSQAQQVVGGGGFLSGTSNMGTYSPVVQQGGDTTTTVNLSSITSVLSQLTAWNQQA